MGDAEEMGPPEALGAEADQTQHSGTVMQYSKGHRFCACQCKSMHVNATPHGGMGHSSTTSHVQVFVVLLLVLSFGHQQQHTL